MNIIVMGVSGCGKTTVGKLLAQRLEAEFLDADDFHPPANVDRMRQGLPLTDDDRAGWLDALRETISFHAGTGRPMVLACSALRQRYRDVLRHGGGDVVFVHLKGDFETISRRLRKRHGHYMPASLLESQFVALEEPRDAITVAINQSPHATVKLILSRLNERKNSEPA